MSLHSKNNDLHFSNIVDCFPDDYYSFLIEYLRINDMITTKELKLMIAQWEPFLVFLKRLNLTLNGLEIILRKSLREFYKDNKKFNLQLTWIIVIMTWLRFLDNREIDYLVRDSSKRVANLT